MFFFKYKQIVMKFLLNGKSVLISCINKVKSNRLILRVTDSDVFSLSIHNNSKFYKYLIGLNMFARQFSFIIMRVS